MRIADLKPLDFKSLDMLHYLGEAGLDTAAQQFKLGPSTLVLDVGAGVGGPARYT